MEERQKNDDNNNNNVFSPLEGGYWAFEAGALAFVSLRNENPRSRLLLQARWGRDLFNYLLGKLPPIKNDNKIKQCLFTEANFHFKKNFPSLGIWK